MQLQGNQVWFQAKSAWKVLLGAGLHLCLSCRAALKVRRVASQSNCGNQAFHQWSVMAHSSSTCARLETTDLIYRHAQHSQLQMKFEHRKYTTVLVLRRKSSSASPNRHPHLWELLLAWSCHALVWINSEWYHTHGCDLLQSHIYQCFTRGNMKHLLNFN